MAKINTNFEKLQAGYLFPEVAKRVRQHVERHPTASIIRLGVGDVVLPLPGVVVDALKAAADEMGQPASFRGYGPEQGYEFLRNAIARHYEAQGAQVAPDEVFVSDGAKCDSGNIQELFALDNVVAVTDPVFPVYVDTNVMAGRTGPADAHGRYAGLVYLPTTAENGFEPPLPDRHVDMVYLCSPNNPTGAVMSRRSLTRWIEYARENESILLFDAGYEAFIRDPDQVRSIFELPGARDVAIEFRSLSKMAGFTGTRCAYTVVPKSLKARNDRGELVPLHALWYRRHTTKFNGVSYPIQRAAEAVFSPAGLAAIAENNDYYLANARIIRDALQASGYTVYGGVNAPYVWLETPGGMGSWDFFDRLLTEANVVCTPGVGFGTCGEGYCRISAFGLRADIEEALQRIRTKLPSP